MTAVYPENIEYRVEKDKTYVDNLKITLAKEYTNKKTKQKTKLTDKTLTQYDIKAPPDNWWASEKLDGIRGIWNGKEFISRASAAGAAKVYSYVPDWFIKEMPVGIALDGEIWLGRGKFQEISSISNLKIGCKYTKEELDLKWTEVRFMVFDSPSIPGLFEERSTTIKTLINKACEASDKCPLRWIKTIQITKGEKQMMKMYEKVTKLGGEGLMIRAPKTPYIPKRTNLLLKTKVNEDSEGIVIGYIEGTGKHIGMVGSLECILLEDGKKTDINFRVGTGFTDEMRKGIEIPSSKHHIPINAVISFSFMEKTVAGNPRHNSYRGLREDYTSPVEMVESEPMETPVAAPTVQTTVQTTMKNPVTNQFIADQFKELIKSEKANKDKNSGFRIGNYNKIIKYFENEEIADFSDDTDSINIVKIIAGLRNVGIKLTGEEKYFEKNGAYKSSSLNKILEILNTGELIQANIAKADPRVEAIDELQKVAYVGKAAANRFYDAGIKSIEELREYEVKNKNLLTEQQSIGLKYHDDIIRRIPRKEMHIWKKLIHAEVCTIAKENKMDIICEIAGSYRRLKKDSGDVDALLNSSNPTLTANKLITRLESNGIIVRILSRGDAQAMVIARLPKYRTYRRLDIFSYTNEVFPYALLHSTGSGEHNIEMRNAAIQKGLSLSQYGFKNKSTPKIKTERDIFEYLEVPWKEPEDR